MKRMVITAALIGSASLLGCKGEATVSIDGAPGSSIKGPANNVAPNNVQLPPENNVNAETCADVGTSLGSTPFRRLTSVEYNNTVRDLFPGIQLGEQAFSADEKVGNFEANIIAPLSELQTEEYQRAAEDIAQTAIDDINTLLASCTDRDEACADAFIDTLGERAYRRTLEDDERQRMKALWAFGNTDYDFETGIRLVIEGTLQSPNFLYRVESGNTETFSEIDEFAVASRLSYFLWKSGPDQQLLDLAATGGLRDAATVEAEARRMMADPKAREAINEVFLQWFAVDSFEGVEKEDPAFDAQMQQSMRDETLAFIDHVLWEDDARLETLLTANYTFVDAQVASLYGVNAPDTEGLVRVELDPTQRRGILTHPSVLARHGFGAMSVHRGKFVRESLFCSTPPEPPPVLNNPPDTFEGQSDRSKAQDRLDHSGCGGCHALMDPIGLAFDNYDSMGRWRTQDSDGNDVFGDGELIATDIDGEFTGAVELAQNLVQSEGVASCVSEQFFRYAFARNAAAEDVCSIQSMEDALVASDGDLKEMLVAMVKTDAFRFRRNLSGQ